ncbi:MAG: hypothetical protein V4459_02815 [Pseudomonadota bacterium]
MIAWSPLSAQVGPSAPAPSNDPQDFLTAPRKPATVKGSFTLMSIGDLLNSHPMAEYADPAFQNVVALIRSGDVTIGNRAGVLFDLTGFKALGLEPTTR